MDYIWLFEEYRVIKRVPPFPWLPQLGKLCDLIFTTTTHSAFQSFAMWFLFWRFAYNIGLGVLLSHQSKSRLLTRCIQHITPDNPLYSIIRKWVRIGMPPDYKADQYPAAFNAWIGFRNLVDIVLANDLVTYVVFCLAYFETPESISFQIVLSYIIGIFLCVFTLWAKTDAYRVVKDFAWCMFTWYTLFR